VLDFENMTAEDERVLFAALVAMRAQVSPSDARGAALVFAPLRDGNLWRFPCDSVQYEAWRSRVLRSIRLLVARARPKPAISPGPFAPGNINRDPDQKDDKQQMLHFLSARVSYFVRLSRPNTRPPNDPR
jgi:hypothetical protein